MNIEPETPCPIEAAMGLRKDQGGLGSVLKESEARRKKLKLPKPLNLKLVNNNDVLLTIIDPTS